MDQVEEIKNKLDIVELVREYLPHMKQSGSNWKALCPFHNEKTPSFMVSKEKQIYHCFGCSEGGDVFEFVKKIENVDFPEALRILAQKTGVVLKRQDPKLVDLKAKLIDLHQAAAKFFMAHLWQTDSGKVALEYLKGRGLTDATIKEWKLGFAPDSFESLSKHLKEKGLADNEIKQSGLVGINSQGKSYDRFRQRVMFPLFDNHGQVIGFTGRLLKDKEGQGKYVNSPQTPIYNKSYVLYGLSQAKDEIKTSGRAVLVEGQMDVLSAHQAGFSNVIASSGTALTEGQLDLIKRYTNEVIFAFDADQAGDKAIARSTDLALRYGFRIRVLIIPPGDDPDSLIKKDAAVWRKLVAEAPELMQYFLQKVVADYDINSLDGKKNAADILLKLISKLNSPIDQDFYIKKLSEILSISEPALRESLNSFTAGSLSVSDKVDKKRSEIDSRQRMGQRLLAWLLVREDLWPRMIEIILPEMMLGKAEQELYSQLIVYYTKNNSDWGKQYLEFGTLSSQLDGELPLQELIKTLSVLAEDLRSQVEEKDVENDWQLLMMYLQKNYFHKRIQGLQNELKVAEQQKNSSQVENITAEINQLISNLTKLN